MTKPERMNRFTILVGEDDPDDRFFLAEAFREIGGYAESRFVEDGQELMHHLRRSRKSADVMLFPKPLFFLLDLNMSGKNGCQAFR